ncbi:50S ribosomal protein L25 [Candidatus Parcubacteria bacterium]|uniref:Large ribosomal subunit protein bL25 n=1 Tax=Candidatus Kaiserbacteria bacterium CG10_big_fil_rev_8_21_14_0_10_47_16 TaxID=1974608 RepID=A0A2H0UEB8_9BACT|nr:50S ribosomal protein L25 [Candidatus Parcubacteria bacterium]PIR84700.1 MAG: 50S ribosomal protein L25 [Candidatus Kaiserbacteria bacterium CG10_big_fil_rev_8_21_14_0_10_47_16]
MTVTLNVEKREIKGKKLVGLRKAGKLPAVVYGPKEEATTIALDKATFEKIFREAGESTIITLTGVGEDKEVLVHDVAFDAAKGGAIHVDFYAIERGKELTLDVALEFVGEAPAVKLGGSLTKVLHEVEVTCRPNALPKHLIIDVSSLVDFGSSVHVRDIVVPEGVKIENDPEEMIALVQEVKEEAEEAPAEIDMDAIAVEEKGKKEEDSEEGE